MVKAAKVASEPGIKIDDEFCSLIPAASEDEVARLKASLIADGCLDPLIIWDEQNTLLDGHTRYGICCEHEIPHSVKRLKFPDRHKARNWVLNHQLGRRNISNEQRKYLLGKLYNEEKQPANVPPPGAVTVTAPSRTAERIAAEHGVSEKTVRTAGKFSTAVDAIGDKAPDLKADILSGKVHATNGAVQHVAKLPTKEVTKVAKAAKKTGSVKAPTKTDKADKWEGGAEAHEALDPLGKLLKSLGVSIRLWDVVKKIVPKSQEVQDIYDGIEKANKAATKIRDSLRRAAK